MTTSSQNHPIIYQNQQQLSDITNKLSSSSVYSSTRYEQLNNSVAKINKKLNEQKCKQTKLQSFYGINRRQIAMQIQKQRQNKILQKIFIKNKRYQIKRTQQKQNKKFVQLADMKRKEKLKMNQTGQQFLAQNNSMSELKNLYLHNPSVTFTSSIGFNKNFKQQSYKSKQSFYKSSKCQLNQKQSSIHLPQLKPLKENCISSFHQQISQKDQKNQHKQIKSKECIMTKIYDLRYFGIQKQQSFVKARNDINKMLRNKFWELQELDQENVYQTFQNFLAQNYL